MEGKTYRVVEGNYFSVGFLPKVLNPFVEYELYLITSQMPNKWGLLLSLRMPPPVEAGKKLVDFRRDIMPLTAGDVRPLDMQDGLGLRLDNRESGLA